jgi:hypothetical protein
VLRSSIEGSKFSKIGRVRRIKFSISIVQAVNVKSGQISPPFSVVILAPRCTSERIQNRKNKNNKDIGKD